VGVTLGLAQKTKATSKEPQDVMNDYSKTIKDQQHKMKDFQNFHKKLKLEQQERAKELLTNTIEVF